MVNSILQVDTMTPDTNTITSNNTMLKIHPRVYPLVTTGSSFMAAGKECKGLWALARALDRLLGLPSDKGLLEDPPRHPTSLTLLTLP